MAEGRITESGLWLPGVGKHQQGNKGEGGTQFDDELQDPETVFMAEVKHLVAHINERPDHVVFVSSAEERDKMRSVFNWWKRDGYIATNPTIKIEHGLTEGAIRVDEDRSA